MPVQRTTILERKVSWVRPGMDDVKSSTVTVHSRRCERMLAVTFLSGIGRTEDEYIWVSDQKGRSSSDSLHPIMILQTGGKRLEHVPDVAQLTWLILIKALEGLDRVFAKRRSPEPCQGWKGLSKAHIIAGGAVTGIDINFLVHQARTHEPSLTLEVDPSTGGSCLPQNSCLSR